MPPVQTNKELLDVAKGEKRGDVARGETGNELMEKRLILASTKRTAAAPAKCRPQVFTRKVKKKKIALSLFGPHLREHVIPMFKDSYNCHRTLMLWLEVGSAIPIESKLSLKHGETIRNNPNLLMVGESKPYAPCTFDTRAESIRGGKAHLFLFKLQTCLQKYAGAMDLASDQIVSVVHSQTVVSFSGIFSVDQSLPSRDV